MYKIKIVDFDSKTNVKQATLRDVKWESGKVGRKSLIYESNILEIFGSSIIKVKEAFDNNGVSFYEPAQNTPDVERDESDKQGPEFFVEIGNNQVFQYTQFYDISRLEEMISKYDYKLNELIHEKLAIYLIHNELDFMIKYPNLWRKIQESFNAPMIFIFLTVGSESKMLHHFETGNLMALSYEYIIMLWKSWNIETLTLEWLYEAIRFNIMI
ncbi:hypothetical protein [Lactococcus lactis]|uniref:Uncharacterized protein n=1 Tax=Lactococcus lactis TaxID=1358 RepID=A0AAP3YY05_9LACT|nr:hypothetical protein [Lactococcus lactis]MDG4975126.1 hypothetical protein [Lactococcus lactis]